MIGALSALETVAHERQQRVVLLLPRSEKGADMAIATEHRAGKGNGCRGRLHGLFLHGGACPFRRAGRTSILRYTHQYTDRKRCRRAGCGTVLPVSHGTAALGAGSSAATFLSSAVDP